MSAVGVIDKNQTAEPAPIAFDYVPSKLRIVAVYDKLENGRKVGEEEVPVGWVYQDPTSDRPWGTAIEDCLETIHETLLESY